MRFEAFDSGGESFKSRSSPTFNARASSIKKLRHTILTSYSAELSVMSSTPKTRDLLLK
ncbi:MAG: hypothetical protein QXY36_02675 [Sulfolobales archaeon]